MRTWTLDREGFVTHWLVAGPLAEPYTCSLRDPNQLRYEAALRAGLPRHEPVPAGMMEGIRADQPGRLGLPWRFQGGRDGAFVNLSDFYPTMQRVRFDAATVLVSDRPRIVEAVLWSYTAADLYCNGSLAGSVRQPQYKPICREKLSLSLQKGENRIYLACETLGVRDTRSTVGLQIRGDRDGIGVSLPDPAYAEQAADALHFLEAVRPVPDGLRFPAPGPEGLEWSAVNDSPDYADQQQPTVWHSAAGQKLLTLPEGIALAQLRLRIGNGDIRRTLEITERIRPQYVTPTPAAAENRMLVFRRIAAVESLNRGDFGFPIANMLSRKYLGEAGRDDAGLLAETLRLIDERVDCADFLVCGLIRYVKNYPMTGEQAERVRRTLTGFRYWMDQDGFDGMCFWSENHCLMFYASAMQAGELYPDDVFPRAGMTGAALHAWGRGKVLEWLEDVEDRGFEEFQSTVYTCVTFAALINVVDFSEPEISRRAAAATDLLLRQLALHTFRGGIVAPQGRVYRGVLYPFRAGAMALMNLADPGQPWDYGEGWLGFYATSRYAFPTDLRRLMAEEASVSYTSGNARIVLEKHDDWCLTSVQSPREPFERWRNIARQPDADASSHAFVKSYNECFHGTTCFQPGVPGYQQHLWYAALDGEAVLFVNHPGSASEGGDMRPGYWHGNGVFPALKQTGSRLGLIYRIPEDAPLHYVHLYCPECRFDEVRRENGWLLLRKGQGFIGFWSSVEAEPWMGRNDACEQRMWGDEIACFCVCAGREVPDMDAFAHLTSDLGPAYDPETAALTAAGFSLAWQPGEDDTQVL